jgi:His/Glu/Gln/Arg/opine family amino acid ABC transporter permease subunit
MKDGRQGLVMRRPSVAWSAGVLGSVAVCAVLIAAVYRMYGPGELAERAALLERRWAPFFDPEVAVGNWRFIGEGLLLTIQAALISVVLSLIFGVVLALMRLSRNPQMSSPGAPAFKMALAVPATVAVQAFRSAPLFLLVIYAFIALPRLGLNLPGLWAAVLALTIYTSCVLAEIVRAGILSLDRGQFEAADALGLGYFKKIRFVVLPQALRRMIPAVVSQLVTLIKDTSLLSYVTVVELTRRLVIIQQVHFNPIESFMVAGAIYFVINFALSTVARRIEAVPRRVGPAAVATLQSIGSEDQTLVAPAEVVTPRSAAAAKR